MATPLKTSRLPSATWPGELENREATWDEAEAAYIRALEVEEAVLSPGDPSLAITLDNLGGLHWRRKDFARAEELKLRAAEVFKAAHGDVSTAYASALNNLGAVYRDWARATGDPALREKERETTEEAARITRALRGPRHPEMTARFNNLAIMHEDAGDLARAAKDMVLCVAVELSLGQEAHPDTQRELAALHALWTHCGQTDKAARLAAGDPSDLLPIVEQIEAEHRAWVAEDPENRLFGPRSPITGATE